MNKFISLFLVLSFLVMSCATYKRGAGVGLEPDQKPGAELLVTKKDGRSWKGELIAVKENSLLLKESESGADVSVDVNEIKVVRITKKSMAKKGAIIGLFISGVIAGAASDQYFRPSDGNIYIRGILFGVLGAFVGAGIGTVSFIKRDQTIQIKGKSDSEIQKILNELRSKARVRDFQ